MSTNNELNSGPRRNFLKQFATGAAILGTGSMLSAPLQSSAETIESADVSEADAWFNKVKGNTAWCSM